MRELKGLLVRELRDTYSAEIQVSEALPRMMAAASSPTLKRTFEEQIREADRQIRRLREVAGLLSCELDGETSAGMEGLIEETEELMEEIGRGSLLDVALVAAAQKLGHYKIAAYGTLCALLKQTGEEQASDTLAATLAEEKETDERLTQIAEQEINPTAMRGDSAASNATGHGTSAT